VKWSYLWRKLLILVVFGDLCLSKIVAMEDKEKDPTCSPVDQYLLSVRYVMCERDE